MPGTYASNSFGAFGFWFWVEGDEFEVRVALVADEAGWMEALTCCGEDATGDGEGAVLTKSTGLANGRAVMWRRLR